MLTTKNQPHHRNEVSQNALFQNRICFIYRKMTFLGQNLAENRSGNRGNFSVEVPANGTMTRNGVIVTVADSSSSDHHFPSFCKSKNIPETTLHLGD